MRLDAPAIVDALAAEYVLGTLPARTRRRLTNLMRFNRGLADAVHAWEERLLPLAEGVAPVAPPSRVWAQIRERIGGAAASAQPRSIWESLGLWRGLAIVGLATALALAVVVLSPPVERPEQPLVVVLTGQDAKPALVASADRGGRTLLVTAVAPVEVAVDRTLELWALPAVGSPRSLGLIAPSGVARIALPERVDSALAGIPALAVSLEPRGGSPTGLPTGPVLFSGQIQRLY
ncbi:MAG TPA: anti-sigma factor [Casimicrobiaceae bacterium]|nr:anti-sigma factor [Casimicrobiaceae bacterium]